MLLTEFGFPKCRSEGFCTGLFAQALSLSPAFVQSFLKHLGLSSHYKFSYIRCEQNLTGRTERPDVHLELKDDTSENTMPFLVLIESKVDSKESGKQMSAYRSHIDAINSGSNQEFRSAMLVLLSRFELHNLSAEPDRRVSWNEVIEMMTDCSKSSEFEEAYMRQVTQHLKHHCWVLPRSGDAQAFEELALKLAEGFPWLFVQRTPKQIELRTMAAARWDPSSEEECTNSNVVVYISIDPPEWNGLGTSWLDQRFLTRDAYAQLRDDVSRAKYNTEKLEASLSALLTAAENAEQTTGIRS